MASPLATLKNVDNSVINAFMISGVNTNINVFNEMSGGALRMRPIKIVGDANTNIFSAYVGDALIDRDPTDDSPTVYTTFGQIDVNDVKKSKAFPIKIETSGLQWTTGDDGKVALNSVMQTLQASYSEAIIDAQIESLVAAGIGATKSGSTETYLNSATTEELTSSSLQKVLSLMGTSQKRIKSFIMSAAAFDKLKINALDNNSDGLQNMEAWSGSFTSALGKVVVLVDSDLLSSSDKFGILAITDSGLTTGIVASNTSIVEDNANANNAVKFKIDVDYGVSVLGCKFNPSSAIQSPTDAQLATAANWDMNVNKKYALGVFGEFKASAVGV